MPRQSSFSLGLFISGIAMTVFRVSISLLIPLLLFWPSHADEWTDYDYINNLAEDTDLIMNYLNKAVAQNHQQEDYSSEEYSSEIEDDDDEDRGLSLEDRSLSRSRMNRKQRPVLCELVKTHHEFHEHGHTFKPSTYTGLECKNVELDPFNFSGNKTREFCYLRRSKDRFHQRGCYTAQKQVPVFKRLHNSTEWIPVAKHVNVGCNCLIGFKYHD